MRRGPREPRSPDALRSLRMADRTTLASTGIVGLDEILGGGLQRDRIYLVQGEPGAGKTTLALQFLMAGVRSGERTLYVTLSETREEIESIGASHGWDLGGIEMVELSALEQATGLEENTLFEPSEVELQETTRLLLSHVERVKPALVVFDSLSELRLLAQSPLRFRRQILALKQHFVGRQVTVLLLDDLTASPLDQQLSSLAHGVVALTHVAPLYGEDRRQIRVAKLRGAQFRGGVHDFALGHGGIVVYPRVKAGTAAPDAVATTTSSGLPGLDRLVGGGLDSGTATLLMGPAGAGKSAICIQYAVAAAARGERSVVLVFDERTPTLLARSRSLGCNLDAHIASGMIEVRQVDPAETSPGELAHVIRTCVETQQVRLLVIDSLNGYLAAIPDHRLLLVQLHELLGYLANRDVTTLIALGQRGLVGTMQSPIDVSYVADTVLLLRYFEAGGRIRKAISVLKKRSGAHENAIRELTMDADGLHVGEPLEQFSGVLTGVPTFSGTAGELVS